MTIEEKSDAVTQDDYEQAQKELKAQHQADALKYEALIKADGGNPIAVAIEILQRALKNDPGYAWSWHCNIAMPMYDTMPEGEANRHSRSNIAAGAVMRHVFGVDTMTEYTTMAGKD